MLRTAHDDDGFSFVEMIVVLVIIAVLMGTVVSSYLLQRRLATTSRTQAHMRQVEETVERLRNRVQLPTAQALPEASAMRAACPEVVPRVDEAGFAGSGCGTAWNAVAAALAPMTGGVGAAREMLTSGTGHPIVIEPREGVSGCGLDRLLAPDKDGQWSDDGVTRTVRASGYAQGC